MQKPFWKLCLYGFGCTPNLIVVIAPIVGQLLLIEPNVKKKILVNRNKCMTITSHNFGSLQYKFETAIF